MLEKILKAIVVGAEQASFRLALAGGFAYSMYCNPRATVDLDFVIFTDDDIDSVEQLLINRFASVYRNLEAFSFHLVTVYRFLAISGEEETIVDLLAINNEEYKRELFSRVREIELDEITVPVVSPEDLIVLKRYSNREQDKIDADNLEKQLEGRLDTRYIEKWSKR